MAESSSGRSKSEYQSKPLDEQTIEVTGVNGEAKTVSALSKGFVEARHWTQYRPPGEFLSISERFELYADDPNTLDRLAIEHTADIEAWLTRMTFFKEDLQRLLRYPYHRFWSHAIYDDSLHAALDTYIRLAPRFFDLHSFCLTDEMRDVQQTIHQLVLRVLVRMATYKESKKNHINQDVFSALIYDNFVFDVPKMIDICVLYWRHELVKRMIDNFFKWQPKYIQDFADFEENIYRLIDAAEAQVYVEDIPSTRPKTLFDRRREIPRTVKDFKFEEFFSLIQDIVDLVASVSMIIECSSVASKALNLKLICARIARFFERVYPTLKGDLKRRSEESGVTDDRSVIYSKIDKQLTFIKRRLLHWFRTCVELQCLEPISSKSDDLHALNSVESFFVIISEVLTHKMFIICYEKVYPIENDLQSFRSCGIAIDETQATYVLRSVAAVFKNCNLIPPFAGGDEPTFATNDEAAAAPLALSHLSDDLKTVMSYMDGNSAAVDQIREYFPDASERFVEDALTYYNHNCTQLLNAILDGNLPPRLQALLRNDSVNAVVMPAVTGAEAVVVGDSIHLKEIGKRVPKSKDTGLSADDREALRAVVQRYSVVENEASNMYDDEYDDTYDSNDVGLPPEEPTRDDDLQTIRQFTTPRVLATHTREVEDNEQEEEDDDVGGGQGQFNGATGGAGAFIPFCTNPEEVRRRREEARAASRGRGGYRNRGGVAGNPRGQGQTDETLRNRHNKERNKAHTANHNRRQQADFKRNRV